MAPRVSVCIPAYNRKDMLRATLWSVLQQSFRDFEVIVSDNASQEDLEAEIVAANDPRLRYIRQEKNIGGAANFIFLQTVAKGEYVVFLCSDDLLLPNCLAVAISALDARPDCGGAVYMGAHYGEVGFEYLSSMPDKNFASGEDYATDRAVRDFKFTSPSLCLYRRASFERIGGWDRNLVAVIDWEIYSRMIRQGGGMLFLHEVLGIVRLHDNRDSNTHALSWGFYHDVMLLSAKREHRWGNAYRTMATVEQLMRDFRLRRPPWRTLQHACRTKAFPGVLLYMPWEISRRLGLKVRRIFSQIAQIRAGSPPPPDLPGHFDLHACDGYWQASELVRARS